MGQGWFLSERKKLYMLISDSADLRLGPKGSKLTIYMLQVSKMKIVKAQAKAVLSEMKRQSTASQSSTG